MQLSIFPDVLQELSNSADAYRQEQKEATRRLKAKKLIPPDETPVIQSKQEQTSPDTPVYTRPLGGAAPGVDVNAWRKWSFHIVECPACPGKLKPVTENTWQCTHTPLHKAHDYMNLLAVRVSSGLRCFSPGMFGDEVIPDPEMCVLAEQYMDAPVCPFCSGTLVKVATRGWECSRIREHSFWVQQGCGVWSESLHRTGRSILKKAPSWAKEMMTA